MQRAKAVEGAVGTTTVANMMNRDHMRVFFRRTAALAAFVALLWAVQVVNWITGLRPEPGLRPDPQARQRVRWCHRYALLHGSFSHLMANTPPLLVMGGLLVATTTRGLLSVNAVVIGLGGALVWLFGSSAIHIGASGWSSAGRLLIARGLVDRSRSRWARHWWSVSSMALFSGAFFRANPACRGRRISSALSRRGRCVPNPDACPCAAPRQRRSGLKPYTRPIPAVR